MKQRVEEMEREANKLRELQAAAENAEGAESVSGEGGAAMDTDEDRAAADARSVFVGNVSCFCISYFAPSPENICLGRLWINARGDSTALPSVRNDQPCNDPLRQIHRASQRVRIPSLRKSFPLFLRPFIDSRTLSLLNLSSPTPLWRWTTPYSVVV